DVLSFFFRFQGGEIDIVHPPMTDDLVAGSVQLLYGIRESFRNSSVGVYGAFNTVSVENIHDAPNAGLAAVFPVSERGVIRLVAAATILCICVEHFECDEKAYDDLGIAGQFHRCRSQLSVF